jgi:hypothetical protein
MRLNTKFSLHTGTSLSYYTTEVRPVRLLARRQAFHLTIQFSFKAFIFGTEQIIEGLGFIVPITVTVFAR